MLTLLRERGNRFLVHLAEEREVDGAQHEAELREEIQVGLVTVAAHSPPRTQSATAGENPKGFGGTDAYKS